MSLGTKPIEQVEAADLQALIDNQVLEGRFLEYKAVLPEGAPDSKKKFLAAVSSFANASGGDLVLGIREKSRVPVELCGVGSVNVDLEKQRLDSLIRDGVAPRLPSVRIREVCLPQGGVAILVRVPRSWAAPHMVTHAGHWKFYGRNSSGKYPLDVGELRVAFGLSEALAERIRAFRLQRLAAIAAGETPVRLGDAAKIVLHVVAFSAFDPTSSLDLRSIDRAWPELEPFYASGWTPRFNIDGHLTVCFASGEVAQSYLQVFRNTSLESVDSSMLESHHPNTPPGIPSIVFEKEVLQAVQRYLRLQRRLGAQPPIVLMLSLTNVRGYRLYTRETFSGFRSSHTIDRDVLLVPERLIEDLETAPEVVARPMIDAVWNAAGYQGSPNFDESGEWAPH